MPPGDTRARSGTARSGERPAGSNSAATAPIAVRWAIAARTRLRPRSNSRPRRGPAREQHGPRPRARRFWTTAWSDARAGYLMPDRRGLSPPHRFAFAVHVHAPTIRDSIRGFGTRDSGLRMRDERFHASSRLPEADRRRRDRVRHASVCRAAGRYAQARRPDWLRLVWKIRPA